MQFFILLLGALVFVFYQFEQPPVFFNEVAWKAQADHAAGPRLRALAADFAAVHAEKQQLIHAWLDAQHAGNPPAAAQARAAAIAAQAHSEAISHRDQKRAATPPIRDKHQRFRLHLHHLRDRPPAARSDRPACRGDFCGRAVLEGLRTQRARCDHHHRFLPARSQARRR